MSETILTHILGAEPNSEEWRGSILLIHGIDGDYKATWQNEERPEWLELLCSQLPGLAIISADLQYSKWHREYDEKEGKVTAEKLLEEYSIELMDEIHKWSLLDRRLVIVAHSLGGVLARQFLVDTLTLDRENYYQDRKRMLRALVFLGCPQHGSPLARKSLSWIAGFQGARSIVSKDLREGSRFLNLLKPRFAASVSEYDFCKIVSVHETLCLWHDYQKMGWGPVKRLAGKAIGPVVPKEYSTLGIDQEINFDADTCHNKITEMKFSDRSSVLEVIRDELTIQDKTIPAFQL